MIDEEGKMSDFNIKYFESLSQEQLKALLKTIDNRDLEIIYANSGENIKNQLRLALSARAVGLLDELSQPVKELDQTQVSRAFENMALAASKISTKQ